MAYRIAVLIAALVVTVALAPGAVAAHPDAAASAATTQPECSYPTTVTDVTGTNVTIEQPPETVVAAQPSDAQLLTELGIGAKLVGMPVGPYTSHLDAPENVTDVSADDGVTPVAETIVDLDADVVLAANTVTYVDGFVEQLREADQTVYVFDSVSSIDEIRDNVRLAGALTDECDSANDVVAEMDDRLAVIDEVVAEAERPLGYYVMGEGDLTTPGNGTFQHEILERGGLENIGERVGIEGWQQLSEEEIVAEDPEWIVYADHYDSPPELEAAKSTTAWEQEQFVAVDSNAMSQPGPHVVDAIETIAATVHPDAYAAVTGDSNATDGGDDASDDESADGGASEDGGDADGSDADGSSDGADPGDGSDDSMSGFGVVAAIASLAGAALLGRRD
ncbi:PGF-CTERM-anchored ABC transporter substrate-binding protein [Halovivax limisalsi]|uniref:PGF-CTERM-anchored ABC transporter substrate-binding protein n=1 Tax=Halovivax limisalsi TaxID=1453760 RepID=UPI001FFD67DF|nr:PGF-CTERM-anchored ABC transporter substrate-binding protein [Halovivax limisalsi]